MYGGDGGHGARWFDDAVIRKLRLPVHVPAVGFQFTENPIVISDVSS